MSLPREILKWIQGLDLSYSVKNPKRDFSNGFLLAEILSRYWREVPLHSFDTGSSLIKKADNWQTLEKVLKKRGFHLSRDVIDGVMHQKNGHVVPLLENIYTFLTKREIQSFSMLEHEEVAKPDFSPLMLTRTADSQASSALHGLQPLHNTPAGGVPGGIKAPKPKPMQESLSTEATDTHNVKFTEVTVKAVDNIALLRGIRADPGVGASVLSDPSVHATPFAAPGFDSVPPATPPSNVQQLMSMMCRDAFRASSAAINDAGPVGLPSIHRFVSRRDYLGADKKGYVWTALGKKAAAIADCIEADPEEYEAFLSCFDPIFAMQSPDHDDWLQAQGLGVKVAQELSARDAALAAKLALDRLLPAYGPLLSSGRTNASLREGILRLIYAHVAAADVPAKLEFFRRLQTTLLPVPAGGPCRVRCDGPAPFLACLAFVASLDSSLPEQVGDFCVYHVLLGLGLSSPSARAASLAILTSLAASGLVAPVMKVLPQVTALAARLEGEAWEVTTQLAVLCAALLDAVLPALPTPSGTPRAVGTPPLSSHDSRAELRAIHEIAVHGASGLTPVLMSAHARTVYQLLASVLLPGTPVPARKVALVALAPRVTVQPHEYLVQDKALHGAFLQQYMRLLLSLPTRARQAILDRDSGPQTLDGAVRAYTITPISTVWDPLAAATTLSDLLQASRDGAGPPRVTHDVMEVFALGVLAPNFADDQNRNQWWGLLKCVEKDINAALTAASNGANAEFHELLVHIITKFFLELGSPDLQPNATLEAVQQSALQWFRGRH